MWPPRLADYALAGAGAAGAVLVLDADEPLSVEAGFEADSVAGLSPLLLLDDSELFDPDRA